MSEVKMSCLAARLLRLASRKHPSRSGERGVALITTLLLLLLLTAIAVTMVLSASSDMLINGYYRNYRGAFYAADSGVNIARQDMVNQIMAAVPASFNGGTAPIPAGTDATVNSYIINTYGKSYQPLNSGQAASGWPEKYKITSSSLSLVANPPQPVVSTDAKGNPTAYSYTYNYSVTAVGQSQGSEASTLQDNGSLIVNATIKPASGSVVSFAAWGTFIDQYGLCSARFVAGTLTGPFFTNGSWNFGDSGSYIFTDPVGSAGAQAGYMYSDGTCDAVAGPVDSYAGTTISPTFQAGLNLGQPPVPLPTNSYSQERAVLDSKGTNNNPVTKAELNGSLRDVNKTPYPSGGASSGVFVPYTVDPITGAATLNGGGIYVEGNANVTLSTSGALAEVYTITQGGTTTTVTIDPVANTTVVSSGGTVTSVTGVPVQRDPGTNAVIGPAAMLYVNGNVNSLSGPGEGIPAVNDGIAATVTAAGNVTVTGDILYKTPPVTTTQNQIPGTPSDTLIPGNNKGQVLGIFTASGDVQMNNSQASGNLEIDASIAMISQGGTGGWINVGPHINTITLIGGRIANQAKSGNTTTRNLYFDRRFSQGGFAPPWYPSTTITAGNQSSATLTSTVQRVKWLNLNQYY
jgi:Tfp pilus assembly protein PilX